MTEKIKHYLRGMASVFQICPPPVRLTEKDLPSFQDDAKALAGDWRRVGNYIRDAMEQQDAQALPHDQEERIRIMYDDLTVLLERFHREGNVRMLQEDLAAILEQHQSSVRQRATD